MLFVLLGVTATAERAHIAVASNFKPAVEELKRSFEEQTGHEIIISSGSTAKLYSQIRFGAPFDVFLSADHLHPQQLADENLAIRNSAATYAIGRLTLWSRSVEIANISELADTSIRRIAIATPLGAPYGVAAQEMLAYNGLDATVSDKLVVGESIGQAFAFVHSGNADIGIVSLSLVLQLNEGERGYRWDVPDGSYSPIEQQAILLLKGANNEAAETFLAYLISPEARDIIESYGYTTP
ncbi:MAG: molybdate ABC transporter substrate-binding protein [Pseudomonadota bacterium]